MKRGDSVSVFLLLIGWLWVGFPKALESSATPEDLMKWGEYDSLIRVLEPVIFESRGKGEFTRLDSVLKAKTFLHLGIAYYATGKREHADDAFTRACDLDSSIKIDRFYVSEEISAHFEGISAGLTRLRHQANIMALNPKRAPDPYVSSEAGMGTETDQTLLESKRIKPWLWWTLGSALVLAGGIAGYFLFLDSPETAQPQPIEL